MGVDLGFPTPFASRCAISRKTTPQSTSLPLSSAPKMVFPIVIITRVGLSGWTIGTKNSRSRRCRSFWQSPTEYPSLGLTWYINLPLWWPSIQLDNPEPPLRKWYVSRHRSAVQSCRRSWIVPSKMFGRSGCTISRTSCSLFSAHGRSSSPSHLICAKSCLSSSRWIGFSGMLGVTFRSEITLICGGAISDRLTRNPTLESLHSESYTRSLALISIAKALEVLAIECGSKSASDSLLILWNRCALGPAWRSDPGASCPARPLVTA